MNALLRTFTSVLLILMLFKAVPAQKNEIKIEALTDGKGLSDPVITTVEIAEPAK